MVKRLGDGLLLTFPTAESAVLACLELVDADPTPLRLRAGAHTGEVVVLRDDVLGHVVNVASVAGFVPFSTYGACKGWLISFSEWANGRYSARGVTVTAVCPGFTRTRFHERMGLPRREMGLPRWMWLDAREVVRGSLRDIARGRSRSVPTLRYKLAVALSRVVPSRIVGSITGGRQ